MQPKRIYSHVQGYLELGLVREAEAELQRLPPAAADSLEALSLRVIVLNAKSDWPRLATAAAELARRSPAEAGAWITWAYATRRAKSLADAEKILLTAETHHPNEPTIQFNLGCYACQRGDLATARRRVNRAIAIDPHFGEAAQTDPDLEPLRNAPPSS
jgi:tetratricopeptide (TPR) repeat protein